MIDLTGIRFSRLEDGAFNTLYNRLDFVSHYQYRSRLFFILNDEWWGHLSDCKQDTPIFCHVSQYISTLFVNTELILYTKEWSLRY